MFWYSLDIWGSYPHGHALSKSPEIPDLGTNMGLGTMFIVSAILPNKWVFDVCTLLMLLFGQLYALVEVSLQEARLCDMGGWPYISQHQPKVSIIKSNHKPEGKHARL